jgi:hypothetical protein
MPAAASTEAAGLGTAGGRAGAVEAGVGAGGEGAGKPWCSGFGA